ncbi:hypothetical protein ACJPL5_004395, partial [Cronobacter sakazakii]
CFLCNVFDHSVRFFNRKNATLHQHNDNKDIFKTGIRFAKPSLSAAQDVQDATPRDSSFTCKREVRDENWCLCAYRK